MFSCHFEKWFFLNFNSLFSSSLRRFLLWWNSLLLQLLSLFFAFQDCPDDDEMHPMPARPPSRLCNKPNSPQRNGFIFPLFLVVSVQITQGYYLLSALLLAFFPLPLSHYPSETFFVSAALTASYPPAINNKTAKHFRYSTVCLWERAHITPLSSRLPFFFVVSWNCERSFFSRSPLL